MICLVFLLHIAYTRSTFFILLSGIVLATHVTVYRKWRLNKSPIEKELRYPVEDFTRSKNDTEALPDDFYIPR